MERYELGTPLPTVYRTVLSTVHQMPANKFVGKFSDAFYDCLEKNLIVNTGPKTYQLTDLGQTILSESAPDERDNEPNWGDGLG